MTDHVDASIFMPCSRMNSTATSSSLIQINFMPLEIFHLDFSLIINESKREHDENR